MNRSNLATAALAGLASVLSAGQSSAQDDLIGRRASLFDLGIYGGGAYSTDWFLNDEQEAARASDDPAQAFADSLAAGGWAAETTWPVGITGGVRQAEVPLPGAGTVIRGGREIHVLPPSIEDVTGATFGFGLGLPVPGFLPVPPGSRSVFSYSFFQADDSRSARIEPNTDNVAFTLDRIFVFPDGNTTTGLFGGNRGMEARQHFDVEQHRIESGLAVPISAGRGTFIFTPGSVTQFSSQEYRTSLSLITLPHVTMTEVRETEERLWGPSLGGAFQVPFVLGQDPAPFPILFLTVGGDVAALFGDTEFESHQTLTCPICGPDFPVRLSTSGEVDGSVFEAGAYFRAALAVGPRANLFVEVGMDRTERGSFVTPANPNQQPIRFDREDVTDRYIRVGGAIGFGGAPPAAPFPRS